MNTRVKNRNIPLSRYCWFWLAIFIPVISAVLMAIGIEYSENFRNFLVKVWGTHKLPLAVLSLSLPLASWAIATHRSSVTQSMLEKQYNRQLLETFFDNERHFESIYGRKIDNYDFCLIQKPDLPSIHSHVYEYKNLKTKGEISINHTIGKSIEDFIGNIRKSLDVFDILHEKSMGNRHAIYEASIHAIVDINGHFEKLSSILGTPTPKMENSTLALYEAAFDEIIYFAFELGLISKDFTAASDSIRIDFKEVNKVLNKTFNQNPKKLNLDSIKDLNEKLNTDEYFGHTNPTIKRANEILLYVIPELYKDWGLYIDIIPKSIMAEGNTPFQTMVVSIYRYHRGLNTEVWLDEKDWEIKLRSKSLKIDTKTLADNVHSRNVESVVKERLNSVVPLL